MSRFWVNVSILIAVILLFIILILQNVTMVPVNLLFWSFQIPLIVLMLICLLGGFVIGLLVYLVAQGSKQA
jgi:uncharacterized integral membrane protein